MLINCVSVCVCIVVARCRAKANGNESLRGKVRCCFGEIHFLQHPQPVLRTETHTHTHPYIYTYRYKHICLSHAVESYSDVRPRSIAYCALRPAAVCVCVCAVKEPCLTAVKTTSLLCADINILIPFTGLERIAQQQDAQV